MAKSKWTWSDDHDGFLVRLLLPRLQAWRSRWHVGRDAVDGPFDDDDDPADPAGIEVSLLGPADEDGERRRTDKPAKAQVAALERLPEDESALDEAIAENRIKPGDLVVMSGFGAGLAWGTALFRW